MGLELRRRTGGKSQLCPDRKARVHGELFQACECHKAVSLRQGQLLVRMRTASRGRLFTGNGDASVFTSIALPSCRAI